MPEAENPQTTNIDGHVPVLVEHLFRQEAGRIVATLTRIFGLEHLSLAEDVVQEALGRALQTWPYHGVPRNPAAWITQAARNLALDAVRREIRFREKEPEIVATLEQWPQPREGAGSGFPEDGIEDDRLRLMFVCCHPDIAFEDQVALALKTLCGFSSGEIATAFLASEAAIAKRLTRAKTKIREDGIPFAIPEGAELTERLEGVLRTLYLLFNEGYKASSGESLIRADLCHEAVRLATLLVQHPSGAHPKSHALLALLLLNSARLPARLDGEGNLLRLQDQNRNLWDRAMMAKGMFHLARSASGSEASEYHLQAAIAACHCAAPTYQQTNWGQILSLYDRWVESDPSPVIALNRAVAVAEVHGPEAGLEAVANIPARFGLDSYYLLHAVLGELELRRNNPKEAERSFRRALERVEIPSERAFLSRRLRECNVPA